MDAELKKVMSTTVLMNNTIPSVSGRQLSAMSKFERAMLIMRMKELRTADRKYRTEAAEAELERRRKMAPGVASAIPALRAIEARTKAYNEARKTARKEAVEDAINTIKSEILMLARMGTSIRTLKRHIINEYMPVWRDKVPVMEQADTLDEFLEELARAMYMTLEKGRKFINDTHAAVVAAAFPG